ncbi:DUF6545 domain-containing protein [Micromonospora sp. NPDC048830]|uniref:DUF6545 domain-containing protein n=1 Tax=Micromonospora sp. NPDC048830 TaxID=3364257 RepID=UPI00372190D0
MQNLGPDLPAGLLIETEGTYAILVDSARPTVMQSHSILHELGHILLNHTGDATVRVDEQEEREAEIAADLLALRLQRAARGRRRRRISANRNKPLDVCIRRLNQTSDDLHLTWLWSLLRNRLPEISLRGPRSQHDLPVDFHTSSSRYRVVIEIHDGLHQLQTRHVDNVRLAAIARAHRYMVDPDEAELIGEATAIAYALASRTEAPTQQKSESTRLLTSQTITDWEVEAARLAKIARLLFISPIVSAELARHSVSRPPGLVLTDG